MIKWGFVYTLGDVTSQPRRDVLGSTSCQLICIGIPTPEDAADAAKELLQEGVELIELCGAFAAPGLASVLAEVGDRVPVGAVFYGGDAAPGLHRLFG